MKMWMAAVLGVLATSGAAYAQSAAPAPSRGYIEAVAQSAFGNVTSQSYGGEIGLVIKPNLSVFLDAGQVRNVSPASVGTNAGIIAGYIAQTTTNVAYNVKEPTTFGALGIRYALPIGAGSVEPYVLAGGGMARVTRNVTFMVGGSDVTNAMGQYGVVLGSDLAGSETKGMLTIGGGVAWPVWQRLVVDFQYRYGRGFTSDQGLNINRAGAGIGFRF